MSKIQPIRKNNNRHSRTKNVDKRNNFSIKMQKKLVVLFILILLAFIGLSIKLVSINNENGENYKKQILSQQNYVSTVLPFKRGDILDAKGSKLAYCKKVYNLIIDAKLINQKEGALKECFPIDENELRGYITAHKTDQYYVLLKQLEYDDIAVFKEMQNDTEKHPLITGIWFEEEYKRVYPYGSLACDALGFTVDGNTGTFGLEEYYNETLNGVNGREYGYLTEDSNVERTTKPAMDGDTIVSTIDANIQAIVEKYILKWNKEHEGANAYRTGENGSNNTGAIVMDPNTGEVLAMASYPTFNLNEPRSLSGNGLYTDEMISEMDDDTYYTALNEVWRNFCISDTYEPGSTAKSLTIAAGLDCGALKGDETYVCNGVLEVSGHPIHCHNRIGHGTLTLSGSLEQSCNVALMTIGQTIGKDDFMKYLVNFNMGLKTNIDLAGEARTDTLIYDVNKMYASDLAISTFGQGYNVTMIQLASAFSSVINGGYYYEPHMVSEIKNSNGVTIDKIEPRVLKQPISETTSATMREYLTNVCTIGTGSTAVPAGYVIGGKTGTAEKYPRKTGNYVVSFIGFAPADDPQVVVYVVIDTPNVDGQAHSTFAQEIAKNIFTEVLPYMQVFRTEPITEDDEEELRGLGILSTGGYTPVVPLDETIKNNETEQEKLPDNPLTVDPNTGYVKDPNTGEWLDPQTYMPIDHSASDLDGIGAIIDDTTNLINPSLGE